MAKKGWRPLQEGDIVDIVAPGMATTRSTLRASADFLKSWGLVPRFPKTLFGADILCANSQKHRLQTLWGAINAKDSNAIWCIRGGYGRRRSTPSPKLFLGLSDASSLHNFFYQDWGWPTIHGSNIDRYGKRAAPSVEEKVLHKVIFGKASSVSYSLNPLNKAAEKNGYRQGAVTGGNLITCQASVGTAFELETKGRILFFEDIGERGYRVDRVLRHFQMCGLFKGVKAVVFGDFVGGKEPGGGRKVPAVLKAFAMESKIPVLSGLPTGHGKKRMPLPFGVSSRLTLGPNAKIECPTGCSL